MKKVSVLFVAAITSMFLMTVVVPVVDASTFSEVMKGFGTSGTKAGYSVGDEGVPKQEFIPAISLYVGGFFMLTGALFMVLMIYAGWLWLSAHGNEDQVSRAKTLLIQATIGLAIIIAGRLIAELAITYLGQVVNTPQS